MFISEQDLYQFQATGYLYRGLPMAFIFFKELERKGKLNSEIFQSDFQNFFTRWDDDMTETMFPDHSYLKIDFKEARVYVVQAQRGLYKVFDIS